VSLLVDPPSGWAYGFPKEWDKDKHPNLHEWIVENGYPREMLGNGLSVRLIYDMSDIPQPVVQPPPDRPHPVGIVDRLRADGGELCVEAANAIESLRAEVRTQRQEIAALREERRSLLGGDAPPTWRNERADGGWIA
jgi:hypothetical protein